MLAAIALPKFVESRNKARDTAHAANVRVLKSAATTYLANEGKPTNEVIWDKTNESKWGNYIDTWPIDPHKEIEYIVTIDAQGTVRVNTEKNNETP